MKRQNNKRDNYKKMNIGIKNGININLYIGNI